MQVAFTLQEVEMKYLLLGLVVTLLSTFMFVLMTKAVCSELLERAGKGKSGRKD
jgi:hypothetical protein